MLKLYESLQKYNIPKSLENEILDADGNPKKTIETFNKVNVFVGPNNSGKSKILRELLKQDIKPQYSTAQWETIKQIIEEFQNEFAAAVLSISPSSGYTIRNGVHGRILDPASTQVDLARLVTYDTNYDLKNTINTLEQTFVNTLPNLAINTGYFIDYRTNQGNQLDEEQKENVLTNLARITESARKAVLALRPFIYSEHAIDKCPKIYVPSIRTLRKFAQADTIAPVIMNDYNFINIHVSTGQEISQQIFSWTNSSHTHRKRRDSFLKLLSTQFFDGKTVELTEDHETKILLIKIGEEKERPIHELGDGLQMIICITMPFFVNRSGVIVIEEPELFIHPGLQKTILKFLVSHPVTEHFQIFLTTHSNHIVDAVNDSSYISIFSIRKKEKIAETDVEKSPNFIVDNVAFGNENILNYLGITSTSVYLSNCSIWVEGITDKLYIQKFIESYLKDVAQDSKYHECLEFKEGVHYSFVLSGGDNIIHWDFTDEAEYTAHTDQIIARKFCAKSFVIVDNDTNKNPERKKVLRTVLGDRFFELAFPEIENVLSHEIITEVLATYPSVAKSITEVKFGSPSPEIYKTKKIGYIIDKIILKDFVKVKSFAATNESLKSGDKFEFCNKALSLIKANTLTEEAKNVVERVLDFIISKNQV